MGLKLTLMALCLLVMAGCGGSDFKPETGPFNGTFSDGSTQLGTFTFTVTDGLVGGTGTLTHNGFQVNVSISAVISGASISGTVSNSSVGTGGFVGSFSNEGSAQGTFDFHGTLDQKVTSGTWSAKVD